MWGQVETGNAQAVSSGLADHGDGQSAVMAREDDNMLDQQESLDSDEVRNDDGDQTVDPPEQWIEPKENESLDDRLAEETPDTSPDDVATDPDDTMSPRGSESEPDALTRNEQARTKGQIDGTPEDGDSFYDVVE
ncbi:uncharacterized protein RMCB_5812 [Mycolicibacterium brisbanense]|uniref:Uncharacterized protein n=2 Tax=Mycolicibacterium brisbanense TaxID=146020 RepID=A0A100W509_9MYCO|nr:uncharacterized protein RMCB_5812 [Mycolicibacterium brisbanense]